MKKGICFLTLAVVTGLGAFAADGPKYELIANYSYLQYNPTVTGFQSRAFNGGGVQTQVNFGKYFGIKGDFQGYESTQTTVIVTAPIGTSVGIIPIGTYKSSANMFTYMFGPVAGIHAHRANFFTEILFGASNTGAYADLHNEVIANGGKASAYESQHPFTMAVGGGVDLNAGKHFALRLGEVDYLLTRYTNPFTQTNNQNNFRYLGGVVFKFGGE